MFLTFFKICSSPRDNNFTWWVLPQNFRYSSTKRILNVFARSFLTKISWYHWIRWSWLDYDDWCSSCDANMTMISFVIALLADKSDADQEGFVCGNGGESGSCLAVGTLDRGSICCPSGLCFMSTNCDFASPECHWLFFHAMPSDQEQGIKRLQFNFEAGQGHLKIALEMLFSILQLSAGLALYLWTVIASGSGMPVGHDYALDDRQMNLFLSI